MGPPSAPEQPPPITWLKTFDGVKHAATSWKPTIPGREKRWEVLCRFRDEGVNSRGECAVCRYEADRLLSGAGEGPF